MRSVPRMTQQLRYGRVQPASSNGLSGLNFGCLRHDCFQKCFIYGLDQIPYPVTPCTCRCGPSGASMNDTYAYQRRHVMHAAGCSVLRRVKGG